MLTTGTPAEEAKKQLRLKYTGRGGKYEITDWTHGRSYAKAIESGTQMKLGFYMTKHFNAFYDHAGKLALTTGKRYWTGGKLDAPNEDDGTLKKAKLKRIGDNPETNFRLAPKKELIEKLGIYDQTKFKTKKNDLLRQSAVLEAKIPRNAHIVPPDQWHLYLPKTTPPDGTEES